MIEKLHIENLGPIGNVDIEFGDLTFVVGPQASGKTLALETLKLAIDNKAIINVLNKNNYLTGKVDNVLNLYYGKGLANMWRPETRIEFDGNPFEKKDLAPNVGMSNPTESVFYIPAQRVTSIMEGAGKSFSSYSTETPFVNRMYGDVMQRFIQNGIDKQPVLFPKSTRLKSQMRRRFNDSIYHGAKVELDESDMQRRIVLRVGESKLPVTGWSAGQREFTPLLLGMYCLTGAPQEILRNQDYSIVIIEEPEMGLHPKAIIDVLLQILELVQGEKGQQGSKHRYQVIVSTHSSLFLDFAWAFNKIKTISDSRIRDNALCELLEIGGDAQMMRMLTGVFDKKIRTCYLGKDNGKVFTSSEDISSLDVWDDNSAVSEWGGMTSFATRATNVLSSNVLNYD